MQLDELFGPAADETAGQIMFKGPLAATAAIGNKQFNFPKGTVVTLTKKLPQKGIVQFNKDGTLFFAREDAWNQAVGL